MLLSDIPPQQMFSIPNGASGTRATLKIMARLARAARFESAIRGTASRLIEHCEIGGYVQQVRECFLFVRDAIRYMNDTTGAEVVHDPVELLASRAGDCDDKATLLAALLESIGHPCRFVAVGYDPANGYEHVYLETRVGNDWLACETTPINGRIQDLGFAPIPPFVPDPVICRMVEHI